MSSCEVSIGFKTETVFRVAVSVNSDLSDPIMFGPYTSKRRRAKVSLTGLAPATEYFYGFEIDGVVRSAYGKFKTSRGTSAGNFKFCFGSCNETASNAPVFNTIREENPAFFMHLGDLHYRDIQYEWSEGFRNAFRNQLNQPNFHRLTRQIPTLYMFDDHDYGPNDSDGASPSRNAALRVYKEKVPHNPLADTGEGAAAYQSFQIGRVVFILTDLRSDSSKTAPRTKMGNAQKTWFKDILSDPANDDKFFVWFSTTPFIIPVNSTQDHWGGFAAERTEIADHIKAHCVGRILLCTGDHHSAAYDDGTNGDFATGGGASVPEFTASPLAHPTVSNWTSTYSSGFFANASQFGIVEVTDTGGSSISLALSVKTGAGSVVYSTTLTLNL